MGMPLLGAQTSNLGGIIGQLLSQFSSSGRNDVLNLLNQYLFSTVDVSRPGSQPLTANPALAGLNHDFTLAGDTLLVLVVVVIAVRAIVDRSLYSQHDIRVLVPRVLVAVILMHASLSLIQMAIDLNNALAGFAAGAGGNPMPWTDPLSPSALTSSSLAQDLFEVVVVLALVVTVGLLAVSYVIRMAVLQVLIASAPLAALAAILPETNGYARTWGRLFVVALFMQAAQVMVLRVATVTGLAAGSGLAASLYALASLWVTLKVPSFLAAAARIPGGIGAIGAGLATQARRVPLPLPARGA
ncbi:MAG: conjugal transfer protein TrbL family protein [Candidatus Dormibacteria bacterium]